jgi:hypothetical protein
MSFLHTLSIAIIVLGGKAAARPMAKEQMINAFQKNTESYDEILDNDTNFVLRRSKETEHPRNRDLIKSIGEDYYSSDGEYYSYDTDPIINIQFKRSVDSVSSTGPSMATVTEGEGEIISANAYPTSTSVKKNNRRLRKNLRKTRKLRKMLKKNRRFQSNRT